MDKDNIIELTGENGDVVKAEYLDTVLVDDQEYVVLLPIDEEEGCESEGCGCGCSDCEEMEVIIMKIAMEGDEEILVPVEDDEELERAFTAFQEQSEFCEDEEEEE